MDTSNAGKTDIEIFEELFNVDFRVEATGVSMGRCSATNDGCSNSCASVGCSATCRC